MKPGTPVKPPESMGGNPFATPGGGGKGGGGIMPGSGGGKDMEVAGGGGRGGGEAISGHNVQSHYGLNSKPIILCG